MNLLPYPMLTILRESNVAIDVQLESTLTDVGEPISPSFLLLIRRQGFYPSLSQR